MDLTFNVFQKMDQSKPTLHYWVTNGYGKVVVEI